MFDFVNKYDYYKNCYFKVDRYGNDNLAIQIYNEEGCIAKVTVNTGIKLPDDRIAIKNYSENEGMLWWLTSREIVEKESCHQIWTGNLTIPVHKLTEKGKKMLGLIS